jgi:hypothetical protein
VEKVIRIAYSDFVFIAVVTQHAMRLRRIVICGLPEPTIFFHGTIFWQNVTEHKMCVLIFSATFV